MVLGRFRDAIRSRRGAGFWAGRQLPRAAGRTAGLQRDGGGLGMCTVALSSPRATVHPGGYPKTASPHGALRPGHQLLDGRTCRA